MGGPALLGVDEVPVIDLSAARHVQVTQVQRACSEWGFFQITDHGIDPQLVDAVQQHGLRMFKSTPNSVLRTVERTATNSRGYYSKEYTKQRVDWKRGFDFGHAVHSNLPDDHADNHLLDGYNQFPSEVDMPGFRQAMLSYYAAMADLSARLMSLIAEALHQDPERFACEFDAHTSFMRLNYYPTCEAPSHHFAVGNHTDAGALTILLQQDGVTALQVQHDGEWKGIVPVPGAFTINVGDMLQVWSNDQFRAPEHRVLASASIERFSVPFFYNPNYASTVYPLSCHAPVSNGDNDHAIAMQQKPQYKPINWGRFRRRRFEGDFADTGMEIQIQHFRDA